MLTLSLTRRHDGWFSYDEYRQAQHALCNAHLLRELVYVEEVSAGQRQWTRPLAKLLLNIKDGGGAGEVARRDAVER